MNTLLEMPAARELERAFSRTRVREALRLALESLRNDLHHLPKAASEADSHTFDEVHFFESVHHTLLSQDLARLQRVINATGIVIHTNMGRAPLAVEALQAIQDVTQGYSNLEFDLVSGKRGGRGGETSALLCRLTGAEAVLVVNNNAAAVLLALETLAQGGEVVISRGELVEIGGAFRVPDVIARSGGRLVEVGTTNKTRLADYAQAITPNTKVLLKVHASNYRIIGFTEETTLTELAALGRERDIYIMEDLGSGALIDLAPFGLPPEPTVREAVRSGADVVAFSGDKLLGGPQCGILVGRESVIRQMAVNPLFRALRSDKMTLAALEATLRLYTDEKTERIPVLRMLMQPPDVLARRARRLQRGLSKLPDLKTHMQDGIGYSGGGTLPESKLPTKLVAVRPLTTTVQCLAEKLRRGRLPIIGRLENNQFLLDVRTIADHEVAEIIAAFA